MRRTTPAVTAAAVNGLSPPTRGEARAAASVSSTPSGLSPPTRKPGRSPVARATASSGAGSGQFSTARSVQFQWPVTEAVGHATLPSIFAGLSPPTRGSPREAAGRLCTRGSISPSACLRNCRAWPPVHARVYPRPHGEAIMRGDAPEAPGGLSPPTRGSREPVELPVGLRGSIPAHTGKPATTLPPTKTSAVYPRPHGEADVHIPATSVVLGLSPPTRGSRG